MAAKAREDGVKVCKLRIAHIEVVPGRELQLPSLRVDSQTSGRRGRAGYSDQFGPGKHQSDIPLFVRKTQGLGWPVAIGSRSLPQRPAGGVVV